MEVVRGVLGAERAMMGASSLASLLTPVERRAERASLRPGCDVAATSRVGGLWSRGASAVVARAGFPHDGSGSGGCDVGGSDDGGGDDISGEVNGISGEVNEVNDISGEVDI